MRKTLFKKSCLISALYLFLVIPIGIVQTTNLESELVKDISPGLRDSSSLDFINLNGKLYFSSDDNVHGHELWVSDGTTTGTMLVKDIRPGPESSGAINKVIFNDILYFSSDDGVHGSELWKSDGTTSGTILVKDMNPGQTGSGAQDFTVVNNLLFFTAYTGAYGRELWRSDGTEMGTFMVKDINPGFRSFNYSYPSNYDNGLINVNGTLFFAAYADGDGHELWKSNGTEAGTVKVYDAELHPRYLTNIDGMLFFASKLGLWKSDGTSANTVMIKDFNPNYIVGLASVNDVLLIQLGGNELWKSDGTTFGTRLMKDNINAILYCNCYYNDFVDKPIIVNDTLFLVIDDGIHGYELWKSDGTKNGTILIKDIKPGSGYINNISRFTEVDGLIYFSVDDKVHGRELWKSDGTTVGTVLVQDIKQGGQGSYPDHLTVVNNILFFSADDYGYGQELWKLSVGNSLDHEVYLPTILK